MKAKRSVECVGQMAECVALALHNLWTERSGDRIPALVPNLINSNIYHVLLRMYMAEDMAEW